jgi:cystathionine gamma-synthase
MAQAPRRGFDTRLVHVGERTARGPAVPTSTPIYTSATYLHEHVADLDQAFATGEDFVYARYGNPTVQQLEAVMADIEGGVGAVACSSGMAALHLAVLAGATPRGESQPRFRGVLAGRDLYGATSGLLDGFFAAHGAQVHTVDMCDLAAVKRTLDTEPIDLLVVEQISNPLLRVVDIRALADLARVAKARLVVDSTLASPVLERPLQLGADLAVHSATKFLGGHADVTGGVVVARTRMALEALRTYSKMLGPILGPFEASLISRGIKTLGLRVRAQCASALAVARWLDTHPRIECVYYPGLENHPQHELATRAFGGCYGALVSCDLADAERADTMRFIDGLKLILPATSLGDVYTLVTAPFVSSHRDLTPAQRAERGIRDSLLRFSIGIENTEDIVADLDQALGRLGDGRPR